MAGRIAVDLPASMREELMKSRFRREALSDSEAVRRAVGFALEASSVTKLAPIETKRKPRKRKAS